MPVSDIEPALARSIPSLALPFQAHYAAAANVNSTTFRGCSTGAENPLYANQSRMVPMQLSATVPAPVAAQPAGRGQEAGYQLLPG